MNGPTFSTSSTSTPTTRVRTTGNQVVEFAFNSATYMVSPDPEHGHALKVTMQGQSMAIAVATVLLHTDETVSEIIWETPFSGRPPEWQQELIRLAIDQKPLSPPESVMG